MKELLHVRSITKRFHKRCVLRDVSFSVWPGEILGLIGPNGAGKTTLMECLAGLMPVNAGAVEFQKKLLPADHRKGALFYLPDAIVPWAEQSVKWALDFFARVYGRPQSGVTELIGPLRLDEIMVARMGSLSKGERKRTMLALGLL